MPSNLPTRSQQAIQHLIRLDEASFEMLLKAMSAAKPTLSRYRFCRHVASAFNETEQERIKTIVYELLTMAESFDDNSESFPQEIADLVTGAVHGSRSADFSVSEDDERILGERLEKIFKTAPTLTLITKAQDVLTEHQHVFYSARIFTDVRPVFSDSGETINAVGLIHNLNIHFGQGDDHSDFYVALDTSDIQSLRRVLDRADAKAKALQSLIEKAQLSYLE